MINPCLLKRSWCGNDDITATVHMANVVGEGNGIKRSFTQQDRLVLVSAYQFVKSKNAEWQPLEIELVVLRSLRIVQLDIDDAPFVIFKGDQPAAHVLAVGQFVPLQCLTGDTALRLGPVVVLLLGALEPLLVHLGKKCDMVALLQAVLAVILACLDVQVKLVLVAKGAGVSTQLTAWYGSAKLYAKGLKQRLVESALAIAVGLRIRVPFNLWHGRPPWHLP